MITILFFALAGFFKSVADTLQHHYGVSVFKRYNEKWWNPAISWEHVPLFGFRVFKWTIKTKYRADAWHLANSGMIVCFAIAAAFYRPINWQVGTFKLYISGGYMMLFYGFTFIGVFNTFYNKILKTK